LLRVKVIKVEYLLSLCFVFFFFPMYGMKAFKEELDHLRIMIESMTKSSGSYTLPMKGKSTFNTIGPLS